MRILLCFLLVFVSGELFAQNLVYKPKNPAFGGDSFNYQWMLSSAEAQSDYKEEFNTEQDSDIDKFTDQLNQQFLNSISRQLYSDTFGEDGLQPGTYSFGTLNVEISPSSQGLSINVLDTQTGETSLIIIPYY